jgi:hypothetical protein
MTDRNTTLGRLDDLLAAARQLDDEDLARLHLAWLEILTSLRPEPEPAIEYDLRAVDEYTISFPLKPGDEGLPRDRIRLKYSALEVLAWLPGITPVDLSDLGLRDAWDVISSWVDKQRGVSDPTVQIFGLTTDELAGDPTEQRLQRRVKRETGLLGPGLRLVNAMLAGDRERAGEFAWGLVALALAEGHDDEKIGRAVEELRSRLRRTS